MAEYIEKEKVLEIIKRTQGDYAAAFSEVRQLSAADVVPVVICRDCEHYVRGSCNAHSVWPDEYSTGYDCRPDDYDFCSYGVRRED